MGALLYDGYVDACLTTFIALWFAIIVATQGAMEGDDHGGHG
ncbi:putative membrane protein [Clostridioides difficile P28]|nr:putative membrane protein [Clostridioides difficile P28]